VKRRLTINGQLFITTVVRTWNPVSRLEPIPAEWVSEQVLKWVFGNKGGLRDKRM
jgi:hypothetical protein